MKKHLHRQFHGLKLVPGIVLAVIALAIVSLSYGIYLQLTQPAIADGPLSLNIIEASLVVQDPAGRSLDYKAEEINTPAGLTKRYLIRDANESYFNRCEYPVGIWPVDTATAEAVMNSNDETLQAQYKKVGDNWYRVWLGTYWQSECAGATDEDDGYIAELQKYITQNLAQQSR